MFESKKSLWSSHVSEITPETLAKAFEKTEVDGAKASDLFANLKVTDAGLYQSASPSDLSVVEEKKSVSSPALSVTVSSSSD